MKSPEHSSASSGEITPGRSGCPGRSQLIRLLRGDLAAELESDLSSHVEACASCSRVLEELGQVCPDPIDLMLQSTSSDFIDYGQESPCHEVVREISQGLFKSRKPDSPVLTRIGKYEVEQTLGQGGMGIVFRAVDPESRTPVAIKLLKTYLPDDVTLVKRFRRECRELGRVSHPNLVAALETGAMDGTPYLVMEYIPGVDLSRLLKRHGPFAMAEVCEVARQVMQGLTFAWQRGVVHRDIKPSNLMLSHDSEGRILIKILDLGLVRLMSHIRGVDESRLSYTGQILGTRAYMPPEQVVDSHNVDHRADLYALGASLFELSTGRVAHSHQERLPSGFDAPIQELISNLMNPDPQQRLSDVEQILNLVAPRAVNHRLAAFLNTSKTDPAPLDGRK